MRRTVLLFALVLSSACGSSNSTPSPSPTPPTPTTYTLSGHVVDTNNTPLGGATVQVIDGPNAGKSANTDGSGNYTLSSLTQGGFTARARKQYYNEFAKPVTLTSNQNLDFSLSYIPPWSISGQSDNVFDMPRTVSRVKITGDYTKNSSNFVVYIDGDLIVNELLGTGWSQTHFEGTYLTGGGVVQIELSSGVRWSFTEVR